jgi:hypothetical protein
VAPLQPQAQGIYPSHSSAAFCNIGVAGLGWMRLLARVTATPADDPSRSRYDSLRASRAAILPIGPVRTLRLRSFTAYFRGLVSGLVC